MNKLLLTTILMTITFYSANAGDKKKNSKPTNEEIPAEKVTTDTIQSKKKPFEYEFESTFNNAYFWRGMIFNKGLLWQPNCPITTGKWNLNTWTNLSLKETGGNDITPELDFFLYYEGEYKNFTYSPQLNIYTYPSNYEQIVTAEITSEFRYYADPIGFYFNPTMDFISNLTGFYMDYGLFREDQINKNLHLESKVLLGWGNKKFNTYYETPPVIETTINESQLVPQEMKSLRLDLLAEYKLNKHLVIRPQIIAFKNFMTEYTNQHKLIHFNSNVSFAYDF